MQFLYVLVICSPFYFHFFFVDFSEQYFQFNSSILSFILVHIYFDDNDDNDDDDDANKSSLDE